METNASDLPETLFLLRRATEQAAKSRQSIAEAKILLQSAKARLAESMLLLNPNPAPPSPSFPRSHDQADCTDR
jgi:hypothetical protein